MKAILVTGRPGVGKSTLARSYLNTLKKLGYFKCGLVLGHRNSKVTVFGDYRDPSSIFPGLDRTSMGIAPEFKEYVAKHKPVFFMEGDRLVGNSIIDFLCDLDYDFRVINLQVEQEIVEKRYVARGSNQDAKFLKAKATKVENIVTRKDLVKQSLVVNFYHETPEDTKEILFFINNFLGA